MRFIVCVKQVPDVAAPLQLHEGEIHAETGRLVLNAYDASAVEAALDLTETHGGSVHVVLVGPTGGQEAIRKALAMGVESATHIQPDADAAIDSDGYARMLADYLRDEDFDVVACGKQAQDTDAGLTGSMLGALLALPFAGNAIKMDRDGDLLVVTRQSDSSQEVLALETPCVVSCSNDMNDPRVPNLKGIMAARRKQIEVKIGVRPRGEPATRVRRYEAAPEREPGRILEGDPQEAVDELVRLLKEGHVI
jgi:electron transfer flavoprotein beta subunit